MMQVVLSLAADAPPEAVKTVQNALSVPKRV